MDINTLLSQTELEGLLSEAASHISFDWEGFLASAADQIPMSITPGPILKFGLILLVLSLGIGILGRIFLGRQSNLSHILSCSVGILLIYVITVVVYTFRPWRLAAFLSPLPFVTFLNDYLWVLPFHGTSFTTLCSNILSLVILAFLINLIDSILPEGDEIPTWYLLRFLTVILAMGLHLAANWAINMYFPQLLVSYAPTVLLTLLVAALLVGVVKVILGVVLTVVNPIIGAIYTFFFSSLIGVQLTKSVCTAFLVCAVFYAAEYFGYTVICIAQAALLTYLPLLGVLLILWYLLGREL